MTIYDGESQLLVKNRINRYLINPPMLPGMQKNADRSHTIYVQNDSPGAAKEADWLSAPDGTIYLLMPLYLYWPKMTSPSMLRAAAGTRKPPTLEKVS